jgi:hypothetical protein
MCPSASPPAKIPSKRTGVVVPAIRKWLIAGANTVVEDDLDDDDAEDTDDIPADICDVPDDTDDIDEFLDDEELMEELDAFTGVIPFSKSRYASS